MIGTLGPIVFTVTAERVQTFRDLSVSKSAHWATHDIIGRKPQLQMTGLAADTASLDVSIRYADGSIPRDELRIISDVLESGEAHDLIVGPDVLGRYVLTNTGEARNEHGPHGELMGVSVSLSLLEYPNDD